MNKKEKKFEAIVLDTYEVQKSLRTTSNKLSISINCIRRILKDNKKIQNDTPSRGIDEPHNSGLFHCWLQTEPMRLRSFNNKIMEDALRTGRLRELMKMGDTLQFKEYSNLKNVNYWILKGDSWRAKITTKTISISVKLMGKDPLSLIEGANSIIFEKIGNLHAKLGNMFYINAGTPIMRFKTSSSEFGLLSKEVYEKLKENGFTFWNDGFNSVYIDKSPMRGLESSGLDSSIFINNFGSLCSWLFEHKPEDIATKQDVTLALVKCGILNIPQPPKEDLNRYIG